uniref:Periviscerokinin-3b n=1 Tax=Panchlora viridis TaxID=344693 RepID=PVK3B_PANVI|nr:RecName: Full=Periviscerokinin-3b; Short=PanVi-PVK-3b [Panchlora viridis]
GSSGGMIPFPRV